MQYKHKEAQSDKKGQSFVQKAFPTTNDQILTLKEPRLAESLHKDPTPSLRQSATTSTVDKNHGPEDGIYITKDRLIWFDEVLDLVEPGLGIHWTEEDHLAPGNKGRHRRLLTIHTQLEIDAQKWAEVQVRKQQAQHQTQRKKQDAA